MKTTELLNKIKTSNKITEKEINLLKRRLNGGEKINMDFVYNGEVQVSDALQIKKALDWLNNQRLTPNAKERKNNPFGQGEEDALNNFVYFTFEGFFDCGNYMKFYIPLYGVHGKNGEYFQYYVSGGKINIIG